VVNLWSKYAIIPIGKQKAPALAAKPDRGRDHEGSTNVIEKSVAQEQQGFGPQNPERVRCFRHEGEECLRCDGSGWKSRRYCAGCGEPSGKPSEGGKALQGLRNGRGKVQPMYCMDCHPELMGGAGLSALVSPRAA
jgi:hypothetical protein